MTAASPIAASHLRQRHQTGPTARLQDGGTSSSRSRTSTAGSSPPPPPHPGGDQQTVGKATCTGSATATSPTSSPSANFPPGRRVGILDRLPTAPPRASPSVNVRRPQPTSGDQQTRQRLQHQRELQLHPHRAYGAIGAETGFTTTATPEPLHCREGRARAHVVDGRPVTNVLRQTPLKHGPPLAAGTVVPRSHHPRAFVQDL